MQYDIEQTSIEPARHRVRHGCRQLAVRLFRFGRRGGRGWFGR
jgi:hypothetical protein